MNDTITQDDHKAGHLSSTTKGSVRKDRTHSHRADGAGKLRAFTAHTRFAWVTTPLIALLLLSIWELYVRISGINKFVLPSPIAVIRALANQLKSPYVWREHIWTTFYEVS